MLQRIQTVYMLLAALCTAGSVVFSNRNIGCFVQADCALVSAETLLTAVLSVAFILLSLVLTIVAICVFKRRMLQMRLLAWAITLATLATLLSLVPLITGGHTSVLHAASVGVPLVVAIVLNLLARRAIMHDERLVRSADRIR